MRSGWVVGLFVFIAVALEFAFGFFTAVFHLEPSNDLDSPRVLYVTVPTLLTALIATGLTWLATRERSGLRDRRAALRLGAGLLIGALAISIAVVVPLLVGATTLTLVTPVPFRSGLLQFATLAPAGIGEELLTRGLGFNALRRGLGDKAAVLLSSVIFGALHIFNPHSSWLAALMVALVGIWFGTMTVKTGSVWLSVGVHLSWNFFEGFIYGQPVSGNSPKSSLFVAGTETTSQFWSGGDFGPEAAGFTALVLGGLIVTTAIQSTQHATTRKDSC